MEKEININVTGETKELVIRKGDALPAKAPKSISITGTLPAPFQFYEGKKETFEVLECHLLINHIEGSLQLRVNDTNPFTEHVITGKLNENADLKKFNINKEYLWSVEAFLKFIKPLRFFFANKEVHSKLILGLQKWSVKVEKIINEHNDGKGNTNYQLMTKIDQSAMGEDGFPTKFDLLIPIFQGYDPIQFTVEIGLDANNATVKIFLISDQLVELDAGLRVKLIQDELDKFTEFACSKVVIA